MSMWRKFLMPLVLAALVSACVTSQDKVNAQWGGLWQARLDGYKELQPRHGQTMNETRRELVTVSQENVSGAIDKHFQAAYQKSFNDGKAIALSALMEYRASDVTANMLMVWVKDQINKTNSWYADLKQKWDVHIASGQKQPIPDGYIIERMSLIDSFALSNGLYDELIRMQNEVAGYSSDMSVAVADDHASTQRAAAAMMMFGYGMQNTASQMQQTNFQNQILQSINRPITCNRFGNSTTCY